MNERIEALAKQAAEYAIEFAVKDQELYIQKLMEKFAELIVNECVTNAWVEHEAVEAEREACAKVCEAEAEKWEGNDGPICFEARLCAVNIRARGEHERQGLKNETNNL